MEPVALSKMEKDMLVQIVLFEGFDLLDGIGPYEVFSAAGSLSGGQVQVELVTLEDTDQVISAPGDLPIAVKGKPDLSRADVIVIPGAAGSTEAEADDSLLAIIAKEAAGGLPDLAREVLATKGKTLMTVCGGSLILGMGGALNGRHAVTHHMGMPAFAATGAIPVQARVVDDGNLISGGGVTSGLDTALYVVGRLVGPKIAHAVETLFEYERRGSVWTSEGPDPVGMRAPGTADEEDTSAPETEMSDVPNTDHPLFGTWKVEVHSPIGVQEVMFTFKADGDGIAGQALRGEDTPVVLEDVRIVGDRVTWSQKVEKPLKLKLRFDTQLKGDTLTGAAKAGMLPKSKVEGIRIAAS